MEFTTARKDILAAIERTLAVTKTRTPHQILTCALITAREGKLVVRATDMQAELESNYDAEVRAAGTIAAPALDLYERVKTLPEGAVHFQVKDLRLELRGVGAKRRHTLTCRAPDEFPPPMGAAEDGEPVAVGSGELAEMIERVRGGADPDPGTNVRNIILVEAKNGVLRVTATNGHVVLRSSATCEMGLKLRAPLPLASALLIAKSLKDEEFVGCALASTASRLRFSTPRHRLSVMLSATEAANVDQVLDQLTGGKPSSISYAAFVETIKAVSLATSGKKRDEVALAFGDSAMRLSSVGEHADSSDEIPAEGEGSWKTVFSSGVLLTALTPAKGDRVDLAFYGRLQPLVITSPGYLGVAMPLGDMS